MRPLLLLSLAHASVAFKELSAAQKRAEAAVLGSLVADAATMGLHWIYELEDLHKLAGQGPPEFHDPPSAPYYKYRQGQPTPYGEEFLVLLHAMNASGGDFSAEQYAKHFAAYCRYGCIKDYGCKTRRLSAITLNWAKCMDLPTGRKWTSAEALDIKASAKLAGKENVEGWRRCPYKKERKENSQAHPIVKVPPLVARYAGRKELVAMVERAIRVHQDHIAPLEYGIAFALLLERVVLGRSPTALAALQWGAARGSGLTTAQRDLISQVLALTKSKHAEVAELLGTSCHLPGNFLAGAHAVVAAQNASEEGRFVRAVRESIMAGGDQSSRAVFAGALLAAEGAPIPAEWLAKCDGAEEAAAMARALAEKGGAGRAPEKAWWRRISADREDERNLTKELRKFARRCSAHGDCGKGDFCAKKLGCTPCAQCKPAKSADGKCPAGCGRQEL